MLTGSVSIRDFKSEIEKIKEESRSRRFKTAKFFNQLIYQNSRSSEMSISFDDLANKEFNEEFDFPSINGTKITSYRVDSGDDDTLRFVSEFSKGAIIKRHTHPDCEEWFYVPKGSGGRFLIISGSEKEGTLEFHLLTEEDNGKCMTAGTVHQISNIGKKKAQLIAELKRI